MSAWILRHPAAAHMLLTFVISGVALFGAVILFGRAPMDHRGALPFAFLVIWGPNIAAWFVAGAEGVRSEVLRAVFRSAPLGVWCAAALPLLLGVAVATWWGDVAWEALSPKTLVLLVGVNLMLGPLGEELGWRGLLYPRLLSEYGTVGAALLVGLVWALWHAPLWFLETPQAKLPFGYFAALVVCFSVVMGAMWVAGRGALGPLILFHLCANLAMNGLAIVGVPNDAAFRHGLVLHFVFALVAATWLGRFGPDYIPCESQRPAEVR